MSDHDSDFEDIDPSPPDADDASAQMDDEEDELLAAGAEASPAASDVDEEEMEYDEGEDVGDDSGEAVPVEEPEQEAAEPAKSISASASAPAPAAAKDDTEEGPDVEQAYVIRNNVGHLVPVSEDKKGPGRVRDFGGVVEVDSDETLGAMNNPKNWPPPDQLDPKAIVVIKAKHKDDDVLEDTDQKGPYGWYARVIKRSERGDKLCMNRKILKLIPKKVVKDFLKFLAEHTALNRSSLITKYQPEFENAKPLPVAPNGWEKCPGIKGTGVPPKKEPKASKEPVETEVAEEPPKQAPVGDDDLESDVERGTNGIPSKAEKKSGKAREEPAASSSKKPEAPAAAKKRPAPAPAPEAKKPAVVQKKGILNFAKSTKAPSSSAAAPAATPAATPATAPSPAPEPAKKAAKPPQAEAAPAPSATATVNEAATAPTSRPASKRPLESADSAGDEAKSINFKRVRTVEVFDPEKSITFWKGKTLYIAELQ
jgi:hypothetical protein